MGSEMCIRDRWKASILQNARVMLENIRVEGTETNSLDLWKSVNSSGWSISDSLPVSSDLSSDTSVVKVVNASDVITSAPDDDDRMGTLSQRGIVASEDISFDPRTSADHPSGLVLASETMDVKARNITALSSRGLKMEDDFKSYWGYSLGVEDPSVANVHGYIDSIEGRAMMSGGFRAGGMCIASYMPNALGNAITEGKGILVDDAGGVEESFSTAARNNRFIGVACSPENAGLITNDPPFWRDKYLKDEFGKVLFEDIVVKTFVVGNRKLTVQESEYSGIIPSSATVSTMRRPRVNPAYDFTAADTYVPRSQRPTEWVLVAHSGMVPVRTSASFGVGSYIRSNGSITTTRTDLRCVEVLTPYSAALGYGVAICPIRVTN